MKNLTLILMVLLLTSCGGGSGGDSSTPAASSCNIGAEYLGEWHNITKNDTINLDSTCRYTGSYCGSSGAIIPIQGEPNAYLLHILTTGGVEGCLPKGVYRCGFQLQGSYLSVNCNGGVNTYQR